MGVLLKPGEKRPEFKMVFKMPFRAKFFQPINFNEGGTKTTAPLMQILGALEE